MSRLNFTIDMNCPDSQARAARFQTRHGEVLTPIFMPVGTQATVKGQTVDSLKEAGSNVLLANTYHLMLRPGADVFRKLGGIHNFMNWDRPVLTDSGGFQIFSLPHSRSMTEDGAQFQSYVDGLMYMLSPETSIDMQQAIGSDIMMVLDQCIPSTAPLDEARVAMELTHRWAIRSLEARTSSHQALFGIVQGACHHSLREESAAFLQKLPFDGLAIGGLAVGETRQEREEFTGFVTNLLPHHLPRYLMGVGTPIDILEAVYRGVDMFDCIIPSQLGNRGVVFTSHGKIQMRRTVYRLDETPLDENCDCRACRNYSRAYLHHLMKASEALGEHLLTCHNITFYHRLMRQIREHILAGTFGSFYQTMREELIRVDEENPPRPSRSRKTGGLQKLGDYEVQLSKKGYSSVRQVSSGEVMHSVNCPGEEADRLYIQQSCLTERLKDVDPGDEELILWDVGLGAAHNAMAALFCFERTLAKVGEQSIRPLRIVSFECDLDPMKLVCHNATRFPHLHHSAPTKFLRDGRWEHPSGRLIWELLEGDFRELYTHGGIPRLIYYDPFSFKTDAPLWTAEMFTTLRNHLGETDVDLYTYSAATAVRVALLRAGFCVAAGVGTGPKESTTIAFSTLGAAAAHPGQLPLLREDWLARWRRSGVKVPAGLSDEEIIAVTRQIEEHPQFQRQ